MRLNAFLILALILPGLVFSVTHTVKLDGSGDFTAIQAALDASIEGDSVLVYPGRYYENVAIQTNGISLISLEATTGNPSYIDSTIVDGNSVSSVIAVGQNRQNVFVRGFRLTNALGNGINFGPSSQASLTNCHITGNTASNGGGIGIASANVTLSGVSVFDNYALHMGGGIYASAATGYVNNITFDPVNRCSIYNNRSGAGQDIYMQHATCDLNIYLETFSVTVPTTYYAIYKPEGLADYQMHFDILNAHHQEIDSDLYVSPDGDDANDGLSPASPLRTIHEGIYRIAPDSLSQNTVHLLPGTYSRTANSQVFPIALKSWVMVQGSGMDNTNVVGELHPLITGGTNPHNDVFWCNYQNVASLSNMAISTQNSSNDTALYGNSFGSMNLSQIHIFNVNPVDLSAIWLYLSSDYESVWDNVTIENIVTPDMGLVDIGGSMSGSISNCKFSNAISTYTSASVWAYPLVSFRGDRNLTFENCEFSNLTMSDDNSNAIQFVAVQFPQQHNNFSFNNCLFSNISSQGGIVVCVSSNYPNMDFTNCTFAGNESDTFTLTTNGNVDIINSIFDNDTPYQIRINPMEVSMETTTLNIDYSCIKDGMAGIQQAPGNTINFLPTSMSSDPLFAGGPDIHDPLYYSLSALSPCINSGTPDTLGLNLLPYDLAGNQRVWDGRIDMGAFEFGAPPVANDDPTAPGTPALSLTAYPNPFSVFTNIRVSSLSSRGAGTERVRSAGITIYNIKGQRVKSIMIDPEKTGEQFTFWDGRDEDNARCSSGIYLVNLIVNGRNVSTRKVTFIR